MLEAQPMLPADVVPHIASTVGTLRDARFHRGMVRVGIGLYGYGFEGCPEATKRAAAEGIGPVARWMSKVIHIRRYKSGTPVGYNSTHRLSRDSVLGIVPVGYADGYPLALSNNASVDLPEFL